MTRRALALLLAGLAACGSAEAPAQGPRAVLTAPVEIVDLAGLQQAIARRRGHPLLLNFWAMW